MVEREFFNEQLGDFSRYLKSINKHITIPNDKNVKNMYFDKVKFLDKKDFSKLIAWLYENWKKTTFPSLADFGTGICAVYTPKESSHKNEPITKKGYEAIQNIISAMANMKKVKADIAKEHSIHISKIDNIYKKTITQMMVENKVYLLSEKKWIHKRELKKNDSHIDFRKYYPPVRWV